MNTQPFAPPDRRPPITDSPWLWLLFFSAAGVVCLVMVSPKYRPRQRRLEMQYMASEEILRRQAAGEPKAREPGQEGDAAPPTTADLIIPLWPLLTLCGLLMSISSVMLWRNHVAKNQSDQNLPGGVP